MAITTESKANTYFSMESPPSRTKGFDVSKTIDIITPTPVFPNQIIDVLTHRIFANQPSEAVLEKIPFAYIEEYSLLTSSLVNQFSYFGSFANLDSGALKNASSNVANRSALQFISETIQGISETFVSKANDIALSTARGLAAGVIPDSNQSSRFSTRAGSTLKPYNGLYQVESTGFKYVLPYSSEVKYNISNSFKDNFSGFLGVENTQPIKYAPNLITKGSDLLKSSAEAFLGYQTAAISAPATYIEVPQYFAAGEYEEITFTFNLLNTYNNYDLQQNYDLLYLLAYQNLPFRQDLVKIQPPKLYCITVPGQTFLPYCYLKSMKVNYVGNKRIVNTLQKFSVDNQGNPTLKKQRMIVPDCYSITLTFVSMVKPAANFLLVPDISVSSSQGSVNVRENIITNSAINQPSPPPPSPPPPTPTQIEADTRIEQAKKNPYSINLGPLGALD